MPRILLILSVVFMLGSAVLGFLNKGHLSDARDATVTANQKVAATEATLEKSKKDLSVASEKLTVESAKVATQEQALAARDAELAKSTTDLTNANADLTAKTAALEVAQKELEDLKAVQTVSVTPGVTPEVAGPQVTELQAQISAMEAEKRVLGDKLAAAETKATELNREIERRKNAILAKGLEGQILAVNQPWGFVILSLGDRNGIVPNAEMVVMRDGERVGKVKITSVEQTSSIADIIGASVSAGQRVLPGDRVIYSGN